MHIHIRICIHSSPWPYIKKRISFFAIYYQLLRLIAYVTYVSILLDLHAVFVCTLLSDFRLHNLIQQVLRLFNVFFMYLYHH